jgi:DNA-binding NtrC family response regulator
LHRRGSDEYDFMPERSSIVQQFMTVLVVDPDAGIRSEMVDWLRAAGYGTREAESFEDARRLLAAAPPDVLVAELRLGAFNGLHLVITARAAWPHIRAVLTTTARDGALAGEARQIDAAYLIRPIGREAFLAAVAHGRGRPADEIRGHLSSS